MRQMPNLTLLKNQVNKELILEQALSIIETHIFNIRGELENGNETNKSK